MAKGQRKRANTSTKKNRTKQKPVKNVKDDYPVSTLNQMHEEMIKEAFGLSNRVAKLISLSNLFILQLLLIYLIQHQYRYINHVSDTP